MATTAWPRRQEQPSDPIPRRSGGDSSLTQHSPARAVRYSRRGGVMMNDPPAEAVWHEV